MKPLALLLLCAAALGAAPGYPVQRFADPARRTTLESALPKLESVFENYRSTQGIPGLVYGVVIDGDVVLIKSLGVRDRASADPVTPDTVFRIASMTKSFTALSILKLRDAGKLSLEDPVAKWIPEFANLAYPTADTAPIRVRQLLSHGAGFPEDNPWGDRQLAVSDDTLTRWLREGLPFSTAPDTAYEYSNYGFALLGRIVARASGRPYREFVEAEILAPLGMTSSTLEPSAVAPGRRAIGYSKAAGEYAEVPALPHGAFGSMGGMLTSARDLGRYVAFHLAAFPPRDDPDRGPVRRASVREMVAMIRPGAPVSGYGYGLSVARDNLFARTVAHGGGLPGFGSYMAWMPEYGVGMFSMANLTYAGPSAPIREAFDILARTGALQPRVFPPSPALLSTRDAIARLWNRWSDRDLESIAAGNLFLDSPLAARRKQVENMKSAVGACRPSGDMQPENWLRGKFTMECDRGTVDVTFTLAPTMPPKVQYLRFAPQPK